MMNYCKDRKVYTLLPPGATLVRHRDPYALAQSATI